MNPRIVFIFIVIVLGVIVGYWIGGDLLSLAWGKLWGALSTRQQEVFVFGAVGLITGIFGSMVAAALFSWVQKAIWQSDIRGIAAKLSEMRTDHDLLLKQIVPAIGGSFTKSLFAFHPMASKEIARILSVEADRLYGLHHKRVIVTTAKDTYTIKELRRYESTVLVWSLEFHITWQWENDSKIAKHPLEDFLLVAIANIEAHEDFSPVREGEEEKRKRRESLSNFLEGNVVKATVVNPLNASRQVPAIRMDELFAVDKVVVTDDKGVMHSFEKASLRNIPRSDLPIEVYAAWALPDDLKLPLPVNAQFRVEYFGHMCLLATVEQIGEHAVYWGHMMFRPSDVISRQYDLKLSYPPSVTLDGTTVTLAIDKEHSGCQFIYEPLKYQPNDRTDTKGARFAEMTVPGPLTDLHQLSLTWKGEVGG